LALRPERHIQAPTSNFCTTSICTAKIYILPLKSSQPRKSG
jgi:hypothetical protein